LNRRSPLAIFGPIDCRVRAPFLWPSNTATEGKVLKNAIGNLAVLYLVIGIAIVAAQGFTGTHCDPPRMVPKVTASYPSPIIGALIWPASFYENVWRKDVPLREYLSPSICVEAKG